MTRILPALLLAIIVASPSFATGVPGDWLDIGSSNDVSGALASAAIGESNLISGAESSLTLGSGNSLTGFAGEDGCLLVGDSNSGFDVGGGMAVGYGNSISVGNALTVGEVNTSDVEAGAVIGSFNYAEGMNILLAGCGLIYEGPNEQDAAAAVIGKYNEEVTDPLFVVGDGYSTTVSGTTTITRQNALVISKNGDIRLGKVQGDISAGEFAP